MASKFLEYSRKATTILNGQMFHLKRLADGFYTTGNEIVADQLMDIVQMLGKAKHYNQKSADASLNQMLEESNTLAATMMKATLAGVEVAKRIDSLKENKNETTKEAKPA